MDPVPVPAPAPVGVAAPKMGQAFKIILIVTLIVVLLLIFVPLIIKVFKRQADEAKRNEIINNSGSPVDAQGNANLNWAAKEIWDGINGYFAAGGTDQSKILAAFATVCSSQLAELDRLYRLLSDGETISESISNEIFIWGSSSGFYNKCLAAMKSGC